MLEKRKLKRRQLIYYLKVIDRTSGQPIGRLVDITTEGLMLVSSAKIEVGEQFKLKLCLPKEMGENRNVNFEARSVWSKTDVNPDFIDTGFQFVRVSDQDISSIIELIQEFELPA